MTETETILNAALDADQSDQVARRALADYYIELGDARGYGYKVLAECGKYPLCLRQVEFMWLCIPTATFHEGFSQNAIPVGKSLSRTEGEPIRIRQSTFASRYYAEEWAVHVLLTQRIVDSHGLKITSN
jgi:hypothetical protein